MIIKYTKELLDSYCQANNIVLIKDYSNEKIRSDMSLEGNCSNNDCVNIFKKSFRQLIKNDSFCKQCNRGKNRNCVIFNWKLLQLYCSEKNIKLDKDYSKEKLSVFTKITGICENTDCENNFNCKFRNLIRFGALCKNCFYKKKIDITKKSNKQKYGVEFVSQVPEIRQKVEETMVEKYGVKYTTQSKELYEKMKNNNMDKYGVEFVSQVPEIRQKAQNTMLEKYGDIHALKIDEFKKKSQNTMLEKYGYIYASQVPEIRQKAINTTIERYGVEYATQSNIIQEKTIQTNLKKYGVERASQSKEVQNKIKETCIEKYGVEHYFQSNDKNIKSINTCLEKYGVEFVSQVPKIRQKVEETCLEKYGVKCTLQSEDIREKSKQSCMDKYGVEFVSQVPEIRQKSKQTCLKKYGVEHPAQNKEIMDKCSKNAYKLKEYTMPSGNIIKIQGYENYAMDEILQNGILEEDIINGCKNVPEIWYEDENGIKHRHYVDIFISSKNRCIEIKSTWTAKKNKDCIFLKQQAGKELGYEYEIWVYNGKGEKVECHK
jgi:hypothetical protein